MAKRKLLIASFFGAIVFVIALALSVQGLCSVSYLCDRPHDDSMAFIFFPFLFLFIFSLITYKMREDVFQSWWKFARVWVPLSMIAVLLAPSNTSNWMFPIEKGSVAFFSSTLFVIISLVQIIYLSRKTKK